MVILLCWAFARPSTTLFQSAQTAFRRMRRLKRKEVLYGVLLLFFSSASLLIEPRNRNSQTNNTREPRARASCKHSATVHPARHRAPAPHRIHRIEFPYNHTKSIPQPSRARPAFPGERSKYALDIRRNASRDRTCGRFLLRHDF